jgi:hypothetical protein
MTRSKRAAIRVFPAHREAFCVLGRENVLEDNADFVETWRRF